MQEEISLREIIDTVWDGKKLIAIITVISVLMSGFFSFFILEPMYTATSTVRIGVSGSENIVQQLNSFAEASQTDVAFKRIIDKLALDPNQYSIDQIRKSTEIKVIKDANVIKLTVQGEDPRTITNISNMLAFELGARIEITDRSQEIIDLQKRLDDIEKNILITSEDLEETERLLDETPEYLVTRQSLSEEPYLHSVVIETSKGSSRDLGALQLESQTINPVYTLLKSRITERNIELTRLSAEKQNIESKMRFINNRIVELEQQIDREKLTSFNSQRLLNGFNAVFIAPAIEPSEPIAPKHLLNIAAGLIAGLMISILIVFFRYYWRNTSHTQFSEKDMKASV